LRLRYRRVAHPALLCEIWGSAVPLALKVWISEIASKDCWCSDI
jgi:hypothetical protein